MVWKRGSRREAEPRHDRAQGQTTYFDLYTKHRGRVMKGEAERECGQARVHLKEQ